MKFQRWHWLILGAIIVAVLAALPGPGGLRPAAAGGSWHAWLYNSDSGMLTHAFPDGAPSSTMPFPLPTGVSSFPYMITFSRDGYRVAACNTDFAGNTRVDVYDFTENRFVGQYLVVGPTAGCSLSRYSFSEDGSLLAFGLLYHYPFETGDPRPDWDLIVLQLDTNQVVATLNSTSPLLASTGYDVAGKLPFVVTFQMPDATFPGLISFKLVRWGTEGSCDDEGAVWNLGQNQVYGGPITGKNSLDFLLANSEAVWVDTDLSLPQGTLVGPGCAHNVVMYSNKSGALNMLHTEARVLYSTAFVDDGRRVVFSSYINDVTTWYAIDRSGAVLQLPADVQTWKVWGTPDGYAFLTTGSPDRPMELRYHRFYEGISEPDAFVAWTAGLGEYWTLVYVNPLSGGLGLSPFPAQPVLGTPPLPPTAVPPGVLAVGGQARTNTTAGDLLRVRTGAGIAFQVAFQLPTGTLVTLREGPVAADGYVWWRIETADGRSGWCVASVPDAASPGGVLQTLLPGP